MSDEQILDALEKIIERNEKIAGDVPVHLIRENQNILKQIDVILERISRRNNTTRPGSAP